MKRKAKIVAALVCSFFFLTACTFNPFVADNQSTGTVEGTLLGAGAGAGTAAIAGASKSYILLGGIAGGAVGYYLSSLRFESGGVLQYGGKVYKVGDVIGIYIPTDFLFEPNSAEFLPQSSAILDSASTLLARYPNNNMIVSGSTSGFARARWEQRLSQARAQKVAGYLWSSGINSFDTTNNDKMRTLKYVGYGDYFPIANDYENRGIRANSRIQIISYPNGCDLGLDKRHVALTNVGALNNDDAIAKAPVNNHCKWNADGTVSECWVD